MVAHGLYDFLALVYLSRSALHRARQKHRLLTNLDQPDDRQLT